MTTILIHTSNEYPDMQANKLNAKYHLHNCMSNTQPMQHARNKHPDMQANKLNAKYHLHVQYSTDTKTQSYKAWVQNIILKEMHNIDNKY